MFGSTETLVTRFTESYHSVHTEYTPNWQLWLIEKSKLLKSSAWNLIFWIILVFGLIIFEGIAWKTYWYTNQRKC